MFKISAEINEQDIKALMQTYSKDLVRKAIRSALDRTGTWGKNYLAADVSQNYNLSTAKVKRATTVKRTTQTNLEVTLSIKGKQLSMVDDFNAWQDRVGMKAYVRRDQLWGAPHAFINRGRGSGKKVGMIRVGPKRYPTSGKPGRGPSIPMLVNRLSNREKRDSDLTNHLYKEMVDQIAKRTMGLSQVAETE